VPTLAERLDDQRKAEKSKEHDIALVKRLKMRQKLLSLRNSS
jgi:hypothetical protein